MDVLERVLVSQYALQRPHCLVEDSPETHMSAGMLCVAHPLMLCRIDTIAPHIHVLTRDIPFILNKNKLTCYQQKSRERVFNPFASASKSCNRRAIR